MVILIEIAVIGGWSRKTLSARKLLESKRRSRSIFGEREKAVCVYLVCGNLSRV